MVSPEEAFILKKRNIFYIRLYLPLTPEIWFFKNTFLTCLEMFQELIE